jgi:hypothetical protein
MRLPKTTKLTNDGFTEVRGTSDLLFHCCPGELDNTVDTSTATDEKSKADILFHTHLGSMVPDFYLQAG